MIRSLSRMISTPSSRDRGSVPPLHPYSSNLCCGDDADGKLPFFSLSDLLTEGSRALGAMKVWACFGIRAT